MRLLDGYITFKKEKLPQLQNELKKFENGQAPHTLFITCSDSRIDPELITNSKPGEIFTVRNAGNFVSNEDGAGKEQSIAATVEFALCVLGIKNVVVCGHTDCGAVKSVNADLSGTCHLKHYIPNFKMEGDLNLDSAIEKNVLTQIENIKNYTPFKGLDLNFEGWVYNVSSGELKVHDSATGEFKHVE